MQQAALIAADRPRSRKSSFGDALFAFVTRAAGVFVLLLLGAIIVALFLGGLPAFRRSAFRSSGRLDGTRYATFRRGGRRSMARS